MAPCWLKQEQLGLHLIQSGFLPPESFQSISQLKYSFFFFPTRATLLAAEVCVAVSISSSAAGHVTRHASAGTCSGRPGNARLHQTAATHLMTHI